MILHILHILIRLLAKCLKMQVDCFTATAKYALNPQGESWVQVVKREIGLQAALVLDSHLTNLGSGVIRPTQSLASSPVTDRMTLNHLHSKGG